MVLLIRPDNAGCVGREVLPKAFPSTLLSVKALTKQIHCLWRRAEQYCVSLTNQVKEDMEHRARPVGSAVGRG